MAAVAGPGRAASVASVASVVAAGAAALLLAACAMGKDDAGKPTPEAFGSTTTHSRAYGTTPAYTCEAARRALLSQGFLIFGADAEHVNGRKNFQPQPDNHVEIEFHATCVPDGRGGRKSIAFVNALQDRYALKKSNNSASVGVGMIGSLSLPFSSSDDAMVKVASETITAHSFYDKFFALLERYMASDAAMLPDPKDEPPTIVPLPPMVAPSAPLGAPAPANAASASGTLPAAGSSAPAATPASGAASAPPAPASAASAAA